MRTGDGRTRSERAADKSPLAYLVLLDRLSACAAWAAYVQLVRQEHEPLVVALKYGSGPARRRVVAEMLVRAAAGSDGAIAYTVADEATGGGNRYSASFWLQTMRGADCIVRLGAKRCLGCDEPLSVARLENWSGPAALSHEGRRESRRLPATATKPRTTRVLYCSTCAPRAGETVYWPADRDAVERVFSRSAAALAHR